MSSVAQKRTIPRWRVVVGYYTNHLGISQEAGGVAEEEEVAVRVMLAVRSARVLGKSVVPVRMEQRRTRWTPSCRSSGWKLRAVRDGDGGLSHRLACSFGGTGGDAVRSSLSWSRGPRFFGF